MTLNDLERPKRNPAFALALKVLALPFNRALPFNSLDSKAKATVIKKSGCS